LHKQRSSIIEPGSFRPKAINLNPEICGAGDLPKVAVAPGNNWIRAKGGVHEAKRCISGNALSLALIFEGSPALALTDPSNPVSAASFSGAWAT
jgi:hypothetical protein